MLHMLKAKITLFSFLIVSRHKFNLLSVGFIWKGLSLYKEVEGARRRRKHRSELSTLS